MLDIAKIPETMRLKERGTLLTGLIAGLDDGEEAVAMLCAKADEMQKFGDLLFVTRNGQVKRTAASEYGIRRSRFAAISLKGDDEVVAITPIATDAKGDLLLITTGSMAVRFKLSEVSSTGRATAGVKGIEVADGDAVRWMYLPKAGDMLLVITDRGIGKRMLSDDIDRQKRATKGQKLMPITKTGEIGTGLAACLRIGSSDSVVFRQKHGHMTTLNAMEISVERRTGKGQLLVGVLLDDVVVDASITGKS